MEITKAHIAFYDARKLAATHRALLESPSRRKLEERFLGSEKVRRMVWMKPASVPAPGAASAVSIHELIPWDERLESIHHGRALGRRQAREAAGLSWHLTGNLRGFLASKVKRGESFEEALLYYCEVSGPQPYAKWARRWARRLGIASPERIELWDMERLG